MPLRNEPGVNMPLLELDALLSKIIIGPCQNPYQVASTFQDILGSLGLQNPESYIRLSLIPLRQMA
jgi:hypothetical protein